MQGTVRRVKCRLCAPSGHTPRAGRPGRFGFRPCRPERLRPIQRAPWPIPPSLRSATSASISATRPSWPASTSALRRASACRWSAATAPASRPCCASWRARRSPIPASASPSPAPPSPPCRRNRISPATPRWPTMSASALTDSLGPDDYRVAAILDDMKLDGAARSDEPVGRRGAPRGAGARADRRARRHAARRADQPSRPADHRVAGGEALEAGAAPMCW